jgi:hypothetical protein
MINYHSYQNHTATKQACDQKTQGNIARQCVGMKASLHKKPREFSEVRTVEVVI